MSGSMALGQQQVDTARHLQVPSTTHPNPRPLRAIRRRRARQATPRLQGLPALHE